MFRISLILIACIVGVFGVDQRCPDQKTYSQTVYLLHPTNCGKFLTCVWGKAVEQDCPAGLQWNGAGNYCDWPENVGCSSTVKEPGCVSGAFSPHKEDCNKFYLCVFGKQWELNCPPGLHFNPSANVCDIPDHANCQPQTTTTVGTTVSTEPTTTDEPESTTPEVTTTSASSSDTPTETEPITTDEPESTTPEVTTTSASSSDTPTETKPISTNEPESTTQKDTTTPASSSETPTETEPITTKQPESTTQEDTTTPASSSETPTENEPTTTE